MDLLFEILLEVYGELMLLIVPEKGRSKRYVAIARLIAVLVLIGVAALVIWGAVLIWDYKNLLGIIPLSVAAAISLFQITAGILLFKRNH